MEITKDISFLKEQKLDVYSDKTKKNAPVVVIVHGGAWLLGSKEDMAHMATVISDNGFVCVCPEYALSSIDSVLVQRMLVLSFIMLILLLILAKARSVRIVLILVGLLIVILGSIHLVRTDETKTNRHPAHVKDIANAIKWTVENITKYNGNPANIHLLGHSAGGALVTLVSMNPRFLGELSVDRSCIKSVISISAPLSFARIQSSSVKHILNRSVFAEKSVLTHAELVSDSNDENLNIRRKRTIDSWPIFFIQDHFLTDLKHVRFLILTAEIDFSLHLHAQDFVAALEDRGMKVKRYNFPQTTHFSIRKDWTGRHRHVADVVLRHLKNASV